MWGWLKRIIDYPRLESENQQLRADLQANSELLIQRNNEQAKDLGYYQERAVQLSAALIDLQVLLKSAAPGDPLVEWATRYNKDTHFFKPIAPASPAAASPFEDRLETLWNDVRKEVEEKKE